VWHDLGIYSGLSASPSNEVGILTPKVKYQYLLEASISLRGSRAQPKIHPHPSYPSEAIYKRLAFQAAYLKETTRTRDIAAIIIADVHKRLGLGLQQPIAGAIVTFYSDLKLWMSTLGPGRKLLTVEGEVGVGRYILRVHEGGLSEL
jgi:hypothetical protein